VGRRNRGIAIVVIGFVTACPIAMAATAPHFTNQGVLLALTPSERAAMVRAHRSPHVYVLATVDRTTFFRFGESGLCYGAKRDFSLVRVTPRSIPHVFGGFACWGKPLPVMDFSVFGASRQDPTMHIWKLQGIADDDVASIQLLSRKARVVSTVPVHANVYALFPVSSAAVSFQALNASGKVVIHIPH
jgi:hypothetical protein